MNTIDSQAQQFGQLAQSEGGKRLPLQVLQSAAGFYIGTTDEEGYPFTRESDRYWTKHEEASSALQSGQWPQRNWL